MHFPKQTFTPVKKNGKNIEQVEDFTYLGSLISINNSASKDITNRLIKAKGSFAMLKTVWKSREYSIRTKVKLFKRSILSVLLYGANTWRMTASDLQRLESFQNRFLRQIHRTFWPNTITNKELHARSGTEKLEITIRKQRHKPRTHSKNERTEYPLDCS